ncbi:MAG: transposase [Methanobrevibacter sp.]|jgi:hypothetical protein|nr:transposase [Candidatus Methanoflexus mossambicus]
MSYRKDEDFNKKTLVKKLRKIGNDSDKAIEVVELVFSNYFAPVRKFFHDKYWDRGGFPRYNPSMMLIILLYANMMKIFNFNSIAYEIRHNDIFKVICCNHEISDKTFARFFYDNECEIYQLIFTCILNSINKYLPIFTEINCGDGSFALSQASKYNTMKLEHFELLKKVSEAGLLLNYHRNNERYLKEIEIKIEKEKKKGNKYKLVLLDMMKKRPGLFTKSIGKKIPLYEEEFNENPDLNFVFINDHEARLMKTKQGDWDACYNIQLMENTNHIILACPVSQEYNDKKVFKELIPELNSVIDSLTSISPENYEDINVKVITFLLDYGYFCDETLEYIKDNDLDTIIDTTLKILEKGENLALSPEQISKLKNLSSKKNLRYDPENNQYICINGESFIFQKTEKIKSEEKKDIPVIFKKEKHSYKNDSCKNCQYKNECAKGNDYRIITDKISILNHEMRIKRHTIKNEEVYKIRWKTVESGFGFLKGEIKNICLRTRGKNNVQKEMYIRCSAYNITRLITIKNQINNEIECKTT